MASQLIKKYEARIKSATVSIKLNQKKIAALKKSTAK